MKKLSLLMLLAALLVGSCARRASNAGLPAMAADGDGGSAQSTDATLYGLVCDGSNDTIIIFLHDPYDGSNPDTLNILEASKAHQVFGTMRIGDKVALLRDSTDSTRASLVIVTEDLLGLWCYKVKPTLRRTADMDTPLERTHEQLPDSIRQLLLEEREYGFALKMDSVAMPYGSRGKAATVDEESPVEYPRAKRYRQWYISNGCLLLTQTRLDSLGNTIPTDTDTAQLVLLKPDSLVLRFADGERSYYRKEETAE